MEATKMTIHRALSELKLIDARIEKGIAELRPVAFNQKDKKIDGHITEEDFTTSVKSKYQSVSDLIDRKIAIKSAIVKSNSETMIQIAGREVTVADAISFKKIVELKTKFVTKLKKELVGVVGTLNKNNEIVQKNVDVLLNNMFGADRTKVAGEVSDTVSKPYLESNTFHLIDPLKIEEKIVAMETEIGTFEADIDSVLSESNAVTFIEL